MPGHSIARSWMSTVDMVWVRPQVVLTAPALGCSVVCAGGQEPGVSVPGWGRSL